MQNLMVRIGQKPQKGALIGFRYILRKMRNCIHGYPKIQIF